MCRGSEAGEAMNVLGVIPARGGSKGLPGKNLMVLGHVSLIGRALASTARSRYLTRVVVSTDSPEIARDAKAHGGLVIDRPAAFATDDCGLVPVLQHAIRCAGGPWPDFVVTLQPTSPFRRVDIIDATIQKVLETRADSAQTVCAAIESPYYMWTLETDRLQPLMGADSEPVYATRQACPAVYQPTGAVYVTRSSMLMRRNRIRGTDHRAVLCGFEESVSIDTIWDFRLAELIAKERGW